MGILPDQKFGKKKKKETKKETKKERKKSSRRKRKKKEGYVLPLTPFPPPLLRFTTDSFA